MRDSTGAPAHALPACRGACAVAVSGPRGRVSAQVSAVPSARSRGPATAFLLPTPWASAPTALCEVSLPRPVPATLIRTFTLTITRAGAGLPGARGMLVRAGLDHIPRQPRCEQPGWRGAVHPRLPNTPALPETLTSGTGQVVDVLLLLAL